MARVAATLTAISVASVACIEGKGRAVRIGDLVWAAPPRDELFPGPGTVVEPGPDDRTPPSDEAVLVEWPPAGRAIATRQWAEPHQLAAVARAALPIIRQALAATFPKED